MGIMGVFPRPAAPKYAPRGAHYGYHGGISAPRGAPIRAARRALWVLWACFGAPRQLIYLRCIILFGRGVVRARRYGPIVYYPLGGPKK